MRSPEKKYASFWLSCLILVIACGSAWAEVSGEITGIKLDPAQKRIVIESKGIIGKHLARVIARPNRLVMYFEDMIVGKMPPAIKGGHLNISEIRASNAKGQARVVMDFQEHVVPPFHVRRDGNQVLVIFGTALSADPVVKAAGSVEARKLVAPAAPDPGPTPPVASPSKKETRGQFGAVASHGGRQPEKLSVNPASSTAGETAVSGSGEEFKNVTRTADKADKAQAKEKFPGAKEIVLAQKMDLGGPASSDVKPRGREIAEPKGDILASAPPVAAHQADAAAGGQMVREVRPPVTPPTPDPRLLVQEITELKFIQVGHNARLVIRGGDHLDYRLTKVSPTKIRIDLINAEIPKVYQKPLKTDLFSTSVEMIVPGSQQIFVQLKDSVPHQVEKKKGVLMVDFPPPRFQMTPDQKTTGRPTDTGAREAFQQAGETRREAVRVMKEEEILKANDARRKSVESLQKQQEELEKQRSELVKRYRITPDPTIFQKPVTMDFQGITLRNAFRLLAEQAGINIIVDDKVTGNTTLRLFQVPLGQVIDTICNTHDLDREMVGNVMRVGKREDIQKLKAERQKEYQTRVGEVDRRLTEIRKDIQKNQSDIEKNLKDLEKVETGEATPTEDIRTEEVGEAGCIKIKNEEVCFFYATVKLVYAKPTDIVKVLQCMFNLNCPGIKVLGQTIDVRQQLAGELAEGQAAGREAREAYSQELQQQGFSPQSAGYEMKMQQFERTGADMQRSRAATAAAASVAAGPAGQQATMTLPYGTDEDLAKIIAYSMLWPDDTDRMIFIKDTADRIAQMKKVIYSLDVPTPQVLVEARLVQAIRDWTRGLGIIWGGRSNQTGVLSPFRKEYWGVEGQQGTGTTGQVLVPGTVTPPLAFPEGTNPPNQFAVNLPAVAGALMGVGIQFGLLGTNYLTELDARLSIGESLGKTKIISRPKVQVQDGKSATIKNGVSIPYITTGLGGSTQTQLVDADLKLEVKPKIYSDGRIGMDIFVSDDEPELVSGLVAIRRREARTNMIVKDGETAVIGGILRSTDSNNRAGWPGLMNIPVVNFLFSTKSSANNVTELLTFITPLIVKRPPPAS